MPVPDVRVTSQINCGDVTILSQKRPSLATMAKSAIDNLFFSGILCSGHRIVCKKWNNTFVTMNINCFAHSWSDLPIIFTLDFVTRENYWQIASLVTQKSLFTVTHALFFMSQMIIPNACFGLCERCVCLWCLMSCVDPKAWYMVIYFGKHSQLEMVCGFWHHAKLDLICDHIINVHS